MNEQPPSAEIRIRARWVVPMLPRLPDEAHRVSTPLELFFDLVIVVAISFTASGLHHGIVEGHAAQALISYGMMFFGIWWAWMNFTWFASSYDTDDVPYRVTVFVQLTGALIFAAGAPRVFASQDLRIAVVGYVIMRVASVTQWVRAARADPEHRPAALRYALGIVLAQAGWVIMVFLPDSVHIGGFIGLGIVELLVPVWAERAVPTTWHPHHIIERYGLLTLIVLGECVLSSVVAIQSALETVGFNASLIPVILGGLLIVYVMWWLYFFEPARDLMTSLRRAFVWGYGHLLIFGVAAAVGAGLAVTVDQVTHHAEISATAAGLTVAIPAAIYLLSLWTLQEHRRAESRFAQALFPLFAVLILLTPPTGQAVLLTGILLTVLLTIRLVTQQGRLRQQAG